MRLAADDPTASLVAESIARRERYDYLYAYPPRQSYRPFSDDQAALDLRSRSVQNLTSYNLYLHVPFCRQICGFCNLYAVPSRSESVHEEYVDAVVAELARWGAPLRGVEARTVYFGGGTPSMLSSSLLARLMDAVRETLDVDPAVVKEVAIEVAPDTATPAQLDDLRSIGFTRVNLGIQSTNSAELVKIGRRYGDVTIPDSLRHALNAGFSNVCVDLIYGLPGQSQSSWRSSVDAVIEYRPETVCAYPLTLRPFTGFDRSGFREIETDSYALYDYANDALRSNGYEQQTHVRWALPGVGGYLQKQYHWASEPLVGFGAGARSYLWDADFRNGYSVSQRRVALADYVEASRAGSLPVTDGFLMDDDERLRKAVILGLNKLDRVVTTARFGADPVERFATAFESLAEQGLVSVDDTTVTLTERGQRFRDIVVQPFVSERVRRLATDFSYQQ